jgi:hypothetical protein
MAKRKADSQGAATSTNGAKKAKQDAPVKVVKSKNLLDDSDSSEDESVGGAPLESGFKVNEEYAKRFEHNKKREELHRRKFYISTMLNQSAHQILVSGGKISEASKASERPIRR